LKVDIAKRVLRTAVVVTAVLTGIGGIGLVGFAQNAPSANPQAI
jgi:hypothetical protein